MLSNRAGCVRFSECTGHPGSCVLLVVVVVTRFSKSADAGLRALQVRSLVALGFPGAQDRALHIKPCTPSICGADTGPGGAQRRRGGGRRRNRGRGLGRKADVLPDCFREKCSSILHQVRDHLQPEGLQVPCPSLCPLAATMAAEDGVLCVGASAATAIWVQLACITKRRS